MRPLPLLPTPQCRLLTLLRCSALSSWCLNPASLRVITPGLRNRFKSVKKGDALSQHIEAARAFWTPAHLRATQSPVRRGRRAAAPREQQCGPVRAFSDHLDTARSKDATRAGATRAGRRPADPGVARSRVSHLRPTLSPALETVPGASRPLDRERCYLRAKVLLYELSLPPALD